MKEIRDAVETARALQKDDNNLWGEGDNNWIALDVLIDLAEKVLAIEGKMPKERDINDKCSYEDCYENAGYNKAIDQCTLAITGALLSEDKLSLIVRQKLLESRDAHNQYWGEDQVISEGRWREILGERISKAIHSAQMEKLKGAR